jgi:proteic killer suppression protein
MHDARTSIRVDSLEAAVRGRPREGVPPDTVDKLRKMFGYPDEIQDPEELRALTTWKAHVLTGDRKGAWSLSVTRNRRLTFRIDTENEIRDVNLEDYH